MPEGDTIFRTAEVLRATCGPPHEELTALLRTARRLLQSNVRGGARVTTGAGTWGHALWVYGRSGRPCRRCRIQIRSGRQGGIGRITFWCPRCQPSR